MGLIWARESEEEKEKREKSLLCGINIFSFHPSTIRARTAVMTIRNLLSLYKDFGPSLSFHWYQVEGDDRDNRWPIFMCQQGPSAFICHYNELVWPDLPVVTVLNQILSPCVLKKALKKQMTHGRRSCYQRTLSHVLSRGPADSTDPSEMPEVA